jgi:hypothetical protein
MSLITSHPGLSFGVVLLVLVVFALFTGHDLDGK